MPWVDRLGGLLLLLPLLLLLLLLLLRRRRRRHRDFSHLCVIVLCRDQDDCRHELSMQALELAQNEHGRPMLLTVDDVLRVLESPTSAHRWV